MINIRTKYCQYNDCMTRAGFNIEGSRQPLYCVIHKTPEMIDVTSCRCIHDGCTKRRLYNLEGQTNAIYCIQHKTEKMININSKKCNYERCLRIAFYNLSGEKNGLYCVDHKQPDMVNVKSKICKTHLCYTQVTEKYDGYCSYCFMNLFPDKPISRNYKTKEYSVVEFVKTKFPNGTWIADKSIHGGCSKRRPDLLLDLGYQVLIIEVDENQHIDYECSCENKRIMELSKDVGHRPIVFIRFNPDDYNTKSANITSCWGNNKSGICVIKKMKKKEWNERLEALENQINYWINPENKTNKTIETIQLFYDSY